MSTPGSERGSSREIARQMLERDAAGVTEVERPGDALQRTFTRVSGNLRRSVGEDGYAALIARAAVTTTSDEPVLTVIPRSDATGIDIDIATAVEASWGACRGRVSGISARGARRHPQRSHWRRHGQEPPRSRWLTSKTG